jgi:predicted  nucleic acid-binding Zn-ribbon protein
MGWPEVVTAVSTAIIAVVALSAGIAVLLVLRHVSGIKTVIERAVNVLDYEARPALQSAKALVDDAAKVVSGFRSEADDIAGSARDVRERLEHMIDRTEERLQDLDSLIDVVQYEVEETALDIAAALRTTRRGTTVVRAMKRAFLGKGR